MPGTLVGEGARFSLLQAVDAVAAIISETVGVFANPPGAGGTGAERHFGIPTLASDLVVGAGVPGAVIALDDFFAQLGAEATTFRSTEGANGLDIAGLVKAFNAEALPGALETRRFHDKFVSCQPAPQPARTRTYASAFHL